MMSCRLATPGVNDEHWEEAEVHVSMECNMISWDGVTTVGVKDCCWEEAEVPLGRSSGACAPAHRGSLEPVDQDRSDLDSATRKVEKNLTALDEGRCQAEAHPALRTRTTSRPTVGGQRPGRVFADMAFHLLRHAGHSGHDRKRLSR